MKMMKKVKLMKVKMMKETTLIQKVMGLIQIGIEATPEVSYRIHILIPILVSITNAIIIRWNSKTPRTLMESSGCPITVPMAPASPPASHCRFCSWRGSSLGVKLRQNADQGCSSFDEEDGREESGRIEKTKGQERKVWRQTKTENFSKIQIKDLGFFNIRKNLLKCSREAKK